DRDDFIIADLQQVGAAHVNEFSFGGAGWADIGPYDYESIMHDAGLAYAVGSHATMHAPGWHEIGQRAEISHGDHDTIDFLYNSCEATFVAPICTTSRDTSSVEVIPYGQPYTLTFAGHFSEDLTVTYPDTTSPAASTTFSMASGVNVGSRGSTKLGFHPTASENGNTFTLSATFTAGTQTVTCSHTVKVQSSAVCFGRPADDPLVCSGRGTCINSLTAPCTCGSGHAGIECEGTQTCQADTIRSFDAGSYAPWVASSNVAVDSTHSASGGGSMFLGSMTDVSVTGAAKLSVPMTNTRRVTFFGAVLSDQAAPLWAFKQGSTTCFTVTQNALGWAMGYREADRYPVNQVFDKLDIRIDWANQQTDLYINGDITLAELPFEGSCVNGFDSVDFTGNGWVDEFHIWCSSYILMGGTVADHLTQSDLTAGGAMITLSLVGGRSEWVDSPTTFQSLLDGLVADMTNLKGWNNEKNVILNTGMFSVTSDPKVLTIGPLNADPDFLAEADEIVTFHLEPEMFNTGHIPLYHDDDLTFVVRGFCPVDILYAFEDASTIYPRGTSHSTEPYSGKGALSLDNAGSLYRISTEGMHPDSFKYYGFVPAVDTDQRALITFVNGYELELCLGKGGKIAVYFEHAGTVVGNIDIRNWHTFDVLFNWKTGKASIRADKVFHREVDITGTRGIKTIKFANYFGSASRIDTVHLACSWRPPTVTIEPDCPIPEKDAMAINVIPGTDAVDAAIDVIAIVPSSVNCLGEPDIDAICSVGDCSDSVGVFHNTQHGTEWIPGVLAHLKPQTDYQVCYFAAGTYGLWDKYLDFKTCGSPPSDAPATDAPATAAPATDAPATDAPATDAPLTDAPATGAPATTAPATNAPATDAPATTAPATDAPATAAPATNAPATDAPATNAPATSAPATTAPATNAPATSAPATNAPATSAPATNAPATIAPATNAPATSAPATNAPATDAPATSAPATNAPATTAPSTNAPATDAPATSAPATNAPATNAPATDAPATSAPATNAPVTNAPATDAPATSAPATTAPATNAPSTNTPSSAPATPVPISGAPPTSAPSSAPSTNAPSTNAPSTNAPSTNAPATNAPSTDAPISSAPGNATSTDAPNSAPATDAPSTGPSANASDAPATAESNTSAPGDGVPAPPTVGPDQGAARDEEEDDDDSVWIWILIAALAAAALCIAAAVMARRSKNRDDMDFQKFADIVNGSQRRESEAASPLMSNSPSPVHNDVEMAHKPASPLDSPAPAPSPIVEGSTASDFSFKALPPASPELDGSASPASPFSVPPMPPMPPTLTASPTTGRKPSASLMHWNKPSPRNMSLPTARASIPTAPSIAEPITV
ncbi:putative PPE family protein PPE24, partial [Diplonema papillatum]